jgi:uncharacterized protein (TIGR00661 family)
MKMLYATQRTGNGHLARAEELIPLFREYASVDVLYSGTQSQLPHNEPNALSYPGISLFYGGKGNIHYMDIVKKNQWFCFFKNIHEVPVESYDLVVNDYEPITVRACRKKNVPIVGLSHQAALWNQDIPKPEKCPAISDFIMKKYAYVKPHIGLHFHCWNSQIRLPIIRSSVRALTPERTGPYVVYLPSFSDGNIIDILLRTNVQWKVFSKVAGYSYRIKRIEIIPIDTQRFMRALEVASGVICGAGFELPAESLFLGKPLMVIPIRGQVEQAYNAAALDSLGVTTAKCLSVDGVKEWLNKDSIVAVNYPNYHRELVEEILSMRV